MAAEIRAEMGRQRVTQTELAARLRQGQPWVSRRVSGDTPLSLDDLDQIAEALHVPVLRLLAGEEDYARTTRRKSGEMSAEYVTAA